MSDADSILTDDPPAEPTPVPRWVLPVVLPPIVAVLIAGYVAGASWATMVTEHPLRLLALSPINRYLLLTTQYTSWWSYISVAGIRHLIPDPFLYTLGFWYGRRAVVSLSEVYPGLKRIAGEDGSAIEDASNRKMYYALAFLAPNNWVSLLCGAAKMPFGIFVALNISGTLSRLVLFRWLGDVFADQVVTIAEWVSRYQRPITIAGIIIVVVTIGYHAKKGNSEIAAFARFGQK